MLTNLQRLRILIAGLLVHTITVVSLAIEAPQSLPLPLNSVLDTAPHVSTFSHDNTSVTNNSNGSGLLSRGTIYKCNDTPFGNPRPSSCFNAEVRMSEARNPITLANRGSPPPSDVALPLRYSSCRSRSPLMALQILKLNS